MERQKDIIISESQLDLLLNDSEKEGYNFLLKKGVHCTTCKEICSQGVEVLEIHLNPLNDIMIHGTCKACGGKVTRIMEFGEDRQFFKKANNFRELLAG